MEDEDKSARCSNCGSQMQVMEIGKDIHALCPNCGRRIVLKDGDKGKLTILNAGRQVKKMVGKSGNPGKGAGEWLLIGLVAVVIGTVLASAVAIVPAGTRGVLLNWGASTNVTLNEGLHFIVPIMQSVVLLNVRTQLYQANASAASRDLQYVNTEVGVDFYANPSSVSAIYDKYGVYYPATLITPILQETIKAVTANFSAVDLITQRPLVQTRIQERLTQALGNYEIIVQQVSITNFTFGAQFTQAIEQKVTAQQALERNYTLLNNTKVVAEQVVARAKGNATARIVQANGTAEAAAILEKAFETNPEYLKYLAISEWNGKLPYVVGSSSALPLISLNATNR